MKIPQVVVVALVAFTAGMLGGVVAYHLQRQSGLGSSILKAERFEVVDQEGKPRALLGILGTDEPGLQLYDQDETGRVDLSLNTSGRPGLALLDSNAQVRTALGSAELVTPDTGKIERRQVSSVVIFDRDGNMLWHMP